MPQIAVNSSNIATFFFNVTFDLLNRQIIFNTSGSTYNGSSGSGIFNVQGISFQLEDQDGMVLTSIDFSDPSKYIVPSVSQIFTLDVSNLNYAFLFQKYSVVGAIKDQSGTVTQTTVVYFQVCQPVDFTESGWVPGLFIVSANCPDNILTVKEETVFVYNNTKADSVTKSGILYYPTGTASPIAFTGTPFSNNLIYTGQYRINNDSTATYTVATDIFVEVVYRTANQFDITCQNKIGDLACCLTALQNKAIANCNNAIGKAASQQMAEIMPSLAIGVIKEMNGMDASSEADFIRKTLACNCGSTSIGQNEMTPINPSVTNIVLTGVGGTDIPSVTTVGNTKTYSIRSYVYQVVKGDAGDNAWSISLDTATANTIKYVITFNYTIQAGYILTAIGNSPTLLQQLNNLITATGGNIAGLNGKCVIDLTTADYVVSIPNLNAFTTVTNIVINGTTYTAPPLFVTNTAGIKSWLDSLSKGTFTVIYAAGILTVFSNTNSNTISTLTLGNPSITGQFQSSNATLVDVLQAIIDYLCELSDLQVVLQAAIQICTLDYNMAVVTTTINAGSTQQQLNTSIASAICNIASRISSLTAVTCAKLQSIFQDNVNASFSGALARAYGANADGTCVGFTVEQFALGIFQAANTYASVKAAFCAIDCTAPATCPDVAGISVAMNGSNIGVYSIVWNTTPSAVQTVTVSYKQSSSSTYIVATNSLLIFPNGSINGTTPLNITGVVPGQTYNVRVVNNCGGAGFVTQITVPTSSLITDNYRIDASIYNICGNSPVQLYSSAVIATGVTMYTNAGLTIPLTGYNYIANSTTGEIFIIDPVTGLVGADTFTSCTSGTAGTYTLGNNTGTICGLTSTTLYTNGSFGIGKTLYLDSSLTTPVTTYSYVLNGADGVIYNLNSGTGVVVSSTGISCTAVVSSVVLSSTTNSICAAPGTTVYTNGPLTTGKVMYSDAALTTPVTGYLFVQHASSIYNVNSANGTITSALTNSCGDLVIHNITSGYTLTNLTSLNGFTLTGTVAPSGNQTGTHGSGSSSITLTFTGSGSGKMQLFKNSVLVSCKLFSGAGSTSFDFISYAIGDALNVIISNGTSC